MIFQVRSHMPTPAPISVREGEASKTSTLIRLSPVCLPPLRASETLVISDIKVENARPPIPAPLMQTQQLISYFKLLEIRENVHDGYPNCTKRF